MKMIYLFLYGEINTDGRVQRSIDFIKSFYKVEIHLVSCGIIDYPIESVIQHQVRMRPLGLSNYMNYFKVARRIIKSVDAKNTLFYLHDYYSILLAPIVKSVKGTFVYDAHELLLKASGQKYTLREKFFLWAEKRWAKDAYCVIAANAEREKIMRTAYGLANTLNILNIADYKCDRVIDRTISGDIWIVYQGVVTESRRLSFFIHALKYLPSDYKLMIIGGGPDGGVGDKMKLEDIAEKEGLEERVVFTGPMSNREMMKTLLECKIGIITYPFDTYNNIYCSPNKLYEYTAIGMPVISSKQPFLKEVITKYKIGGLFDFENEEGFAETVQSIIVNYDEYVDNIPSFIHDYNIKIEKQKLIEVLKPLLQL